MPIPPQTRKALVDRSIGLCCRITYKTIVSRQREIAALTVKHKG